MRDAGGDVAGEDEERIVVSGFAVGGAITTTAEIYDGFEYTGAGAVVVRRLPGCVSFQELITDDRARERTRRGCG